MTSVVIAASMLIRMRVKEERACGGEKGYDDDDGSSSGK